MRDPSKTPLTKQYLKAFYGAVQDGSPARVKAFLHKFGDQYVDMIFEHGWTALTTAVIVGNPETFELLLEHSAKTGTRESFDKATRTALYYACMNGRENIVTLLLKHNTSLEESNRCIEKALKNGSPTIARLLQEEPERRRLIAEEKQRARKAVFNVFTTGLPHGLRRPKLKLKLPKQRGPV